MLTEFGCKIAPSTYYAALTRPPSARAVRDEELMELMELIEKIYVENYSVYGPRKVWWQLRRGGVAVGRCRVERLMRRRGWKGAVRGKTVRTTIADPAGARAADLVRRQFAAGAPNRLWVADFTYVATWAATWAATVYVAFAVDVFSRKIVGWRASMSKETDLVLDAIDMGLRARRYRPSTDPARTGSGWCIIPMRVASTRRSGSPSICSTPESTRRSGVSGMRWITRWRSR
mgnify:CR=1 FL=1